MDYAQAGTTAAQPQSEAAYIMAALDRALFLADRVRHLRDTALGARAQKDDTSGATGVLEVTPIGSLNELRDTAFKLNEHINTALYDLEAVYDALNIRN